MRNFKFVFAAILMTVFTGNSLATDVSGNQSGTWTLANSPYIVKGSITIPADSVLTIEAGVIVKFDGYYNIKVMGTLLADGSLANRIIFTSNKSTPAPGDWQCLYLVSTMTSVLNYCIIEYGGNWGDANVFIGDHFNSLTGACNLTNSIIRHSLYCGIRIERNSKPMIVNDTITDNGLNGIYMYNSVNAEIGDNVITNNDTFAITMDMSCSPNFYGNTVSGNSGDAVQITGGSTKENCTWKNDLPYVVTSNSTVATGDTLTIEPGVTVKFEPYNLWIDGTLIADGTQQDTITFTSNKTSPDIGDWQCIAFTDSGNGSVMDYCIVEYGGYGSANINIGYNGAVTDLSITHSIIRKSYYDGIKVGYGSTPTITNNLITENHYVGIYCVSSGNPTINFNDIVNNGTYGVYVTGTPTVNAENNWWGDSTGPAGEGPGIGDSVSTYVDYDPWLKQPAVGIEEKSNIKNQMLNLEISQNPFRYSTSICYSIPVNSKLQLTICDVSGRCVKTLANGEKTAGSYSVNLDGSGLGTGIYFVTLIIDNRMETKKLVLMR